MLALLSISLSSAEAADRYRRVAWLSGSFGNEAEFSEWRGVPVAIAGMAYNNGDEELRECISLDPQWAPPTKFAIIETTYSLIDIGRGDNWAMAARGELTEVWRRGMVSLRESWGTRKCLFIRPAHEFNGQERWKVMPGEEEDFRRAWRRFHRVVQEELVQHGKPIFLTFNPNHESWGGAVEVTDAVYPGSKFVDVIAVDYYDNGRHKDELSWFRVANSTTPQGNPYGLYTWQAFARRHRKPFAVPEWGLSFARDEVNDNAFFIYKMNEFFRQNAGKRSGQVLYECYFTAWDNNRLRDPTQVPNAAATYKALKWSDGARVAWPR